jgi:CBS domain containing-hemolysin-like protein
MALSSNGNGNGARETKRPRGLLGPLMRLFGPKLEAAPGEAEASLQKDLEEVIGEHEGSAAAFSATQRDILSNLVEFGRLRTDDVMVPRADITAIDVETPFVEAMAIFKDASHSRLPVYRGTLDDPVGMVHIKDLMAVVAERETGDGRNDWPPLSQLRREVLCVPPSMPLAELLVRMQTTHIHMALVIDEYGGTDGLLTIEDLVEEIVGDIEDEHDIDTSPHLIRVADGTYLADARLEIPEFEEKTGLDLTPEDWDEDVDTLGGLVFSLLGRVPQRGEVVRHPAGLELQVVDADPRRVKRLRVCPLAEETGTGGGGVEGADEPGRQAEHAGDAVSGQESGPEGGEKSGEERST